jgi:hypothetical protein
MSSAGVLSGTPSAAGTYGVTATVADGEGHTAGLNWTMTVYPPIVSSCAGAHAVAGAPIVPVRLLASGGSGAPYAFAALGLPPGLTISPDGMVSGTPTGANVFSYPVTVTDSRGNSGQSTCSMTVDYPPVTSTCPAVSGIQGAAIAPVTLAATGGTGSGFVFSAAGLPAGLSMSASGTLSGTPSGSGTFAYAVTITDGAGHSATINCTLTVLPPVSATCVPISAIVGAAISPVTMAASGGSGSGYSFSATGLPAGLSMSASGTLSGVPTDAGSYVYVAIARDAGGNSASATCSATVAAAPLIAAGPYTTYTQGGWGAKPAGKNPGALLVSEFATVYGAGTASIGGTNRLVFDAAPAIGAFLPQTGRAGALTHSATDPTSSEAGVFGGQVLALQLNVDFSSAGITRRGLASLKIASGPLEQYTVAQVLAMANALLGGGSAPVSIVALSPVLDSINSNFDEGVVDRGYLR